MALFFYQFTPLYGHNLETEGATLKVDKNRDKCVIFVYLTLRNQSSPNLCVNYFFSRALVVQGMPLHPCLRTSTLEGAVKGAPLRTSKRFP